jgi:alginate O-acetyltransferase complex protein AlgI
MIFSEPRFLGFFLLVFTLHWLLRSNRSRKTLLLFSSLYFYGSWDHRFLLLIVGAAFCDWLCAHRIAASRARGGRPVGWLWLSLTYNLGMLGFFKYFGFFADSAVGFFGWLGLPVSEVTLDIVLPVGISFFTFQAMSYTLDVWRGRLEPVRSPFEFLLYVSFFPQLVAGPIVRASTFLPQLATKRRFKDVDVQSAVAQFLSGFIKKALIADLIAAPVDQVFSAPGDFSAASIWIATILYAVQIYCDFSGYSDMAIGTARLLGYELCQNFRAPYLASDITDFWRRWHISLSSWLRDYLYISLGGNRGTRWFTHRNLMLTMLLGGLWHGAGWNFVVWGAIHGLALVVHKEWMRVFGSGRLPVLSRLLTLHTVLLAWIFFRAGSFADAWTMARAFVTFESPGLQAVTVPSLVPGSDPWTAFAALISPLLALHILAHIRVPQRLPLPAWVVSPTLGAVAALALAFMPLEARPFIYFQF